MFWNHSSWRDYSKNDNPDVDAGLSLFKDQNSQLASAVEQFGKRSLDIAPGPAATAEVPPPDQLQLTRIQWIVLEFYRQKHGKQPILVKLCLDRAGSDRSELYFTIYWSENPAIPNSPNPSPDPTYGRHEVEALSGLPAPLHKLSEIYGVNLDKAEEFADFFCSFTAGDEGPFSIVQSPDEIKWASGVTRILKGELQKEILKNEIGGDKTYRWPPDPNFYRPLATFDECLKAIEDRLTNSKIFRPNYDPAKSDESQIVEFFNAPKLSDRVRGIRRKRVKQSFVTPVSGGDKFPSPGFVHLAVVIQYGIKLFRALLRVSSNGQVEMITDHALHPLADALPIQSYEFNQKLNVGNFKFLVTLPYNSAGVRKELNAALGQSHAPGSDPASNSINAPAMTVGPAHEENQVQGDGQTFASSLHFVRVEFFGDVSFENAVFRGNVTFESCRFLGQVNFGNARVNGTLRFHRCFFFGLDFSTADETDKSSRPLKPFGRCADFGSAVIARSLLFERCNFSDSLLLSRIHVEGKTRFLGCSVEPLYDADLIKESIPLLNASASPGNLRKSIARIPIHKRFSGNANAALDLRYGCFDGGLDLAAIYAVRDSGFQMSSQDTASRATIVVGPVRAEHCVIKGGLSLSGLITCDLNPELFSNLGWSWLWVSFEDSEIQRGVRAWSPGEGPLEGFHQLRTVIHGLLDLTHCRISGDVDLRGAWIGGALNARGLVASGTVNLAALSQSTLDASDDISELDLPVAGRLEQLVYNLSAPLFARLPKSEDDEALSYRIVGFGRTHIAGNLDFTAAKCGKLQLDGCFAQGVVSCDGGEFKEISAVPAISPVSRKSDLKKLFEESKDSTQDDKSADRFALYLHECRLSIHAFPKKHGNYLGVLVMNTEVQGFRMRDAQVKGRFSTAGISVGVDRFADTTEIWYGNESVDHFQEPTMAKLASKQMSRFTARFTAEVANLPAFQIENCTIEGPVFLFDPDFSKEWLFRQGLQIKDELGSLLIGNSSPNATVPDATLARELDQLLVMVDRSRVFGNFRIENTLIDGKLFLSNLDVRGRIEVRDVVLKSDLVAGWPRPHPKVTDTSAICVVTTEARSLDLEMLNCDGDVLLPGLRLSESLSARNIQVRGHFDLLLQGLVNGDDLGRLATTPQQRAGKACSAIIAGPVDLGGSELAWLQCISNYYPIKLEPNKKHWVLEQTRVKRLVFFDPFPISLNIRGSDWSALDLPSDKHSPKLVTELRSKLFGICDPPIEMLVLDERLLRKEGHVESANSVYARHLREEHGAVMGRIQAWFFRIIVNRWAPVISAAGLLLLFAVAAALVYPRENWTDDSSHATPVATAASSGASTSKRSDPIMPNPQNWHFFWRAFDIAVPVVNIRSHANGEETRLKDNGSATLGFFPIPVSPAFSAAVISALGALFGAMFLVAISGIAKRE